MEKAQSTIEFTFAMIAIMFLVYGMVNQVFLVNQGIQE